MAEVSDSGTFIVVDGQVLEAVAIEAHLENVGLGAQGYVIHNGIHHLLFAVKMPMDCAVCQAYTSRARAQSGDLTAVEHCPRHQEATANASS